MKNEKKRFDHVIIQRSLHMRTLNAALIFFFLLAVAGCQKNQVTPSTSTNQSTVDLKVMSNDLTQVNLVSDAAQYNPTFIDPNLVNAWGLAISDEGEVWVSSADKGLATVYDGQGQQTEPAIDIPFDGDPNGGAPTGALYNPTESFIIPATNEKSEFIYATENGTILGAASGVAYTLADRSSSGSVYKGLAQANSGGNSYLYATDFHNATIDVYNGNFVYQNWGSFTDPDMPAGYAPFNIREIDGQLYVTYAKQLAPENKDDDAGVGHGYVDVYNTDGSFVKRFASQGTLNSPWGIEKIPGSHPGIMIGNFGSGKINVFDMNGNFMMNLKSGGSPIKIDGLWSITFAGTNLPANERNRLYFTAGPDGESHGIFGYLTPN